MVRKTRITYFFRKPRHGEFSIERLFAVLIREVANRGYEVEVKLCPFYSNGVFRRIALLFWAAANQGDINHITGDVDFLCLLMRKKRTILTIHDIASVYRLSGLKRKLYEMVWLSLPLRRAGWVTAISEKTRREILPYAKRPEKIRVISNCITVPMGSRVIKKINETPNILVIGTRPNKNLSRVIEAVSTLPSCVLSIIGPLSEGQKDALAAAGVIYRNRASLSDAEMVEEYTASDILVFASTYEGFGLPILEAQALGVPVITSDREPMRSIVGRSGVLVDPESIDQIRHGIALLLGDERLRGKSIEEGWRNVENYSPERIADQYCALYEEIYQSSS